MEACSYHTLQESAPASSSAITRIGRAAILLSALFIGGDSKSDDPPLPSVQSLSSLLRDPTIPDVSAFDGQSLLPTRFSISSPDTGTPLFVEIDMAGDEIRLTVNGKSYGIRNNSIIPGMRLGTLVKDIRLEGSSVHFASDYCNATVERAETERVLTLLGAHDDSRLTTDVRAHCEVVPSTMLAPLLHYTLAEKTSFELVFERVAAPQIPFVLADSH